MYVKPYHNSCKSPLFPKAHKSEGKDSPEKRHIQYDSLIAIVLLAGEVWNNKVTETLSLCSVLR